MKKERGFVLITAIVVMGVLAAFGAAFYLTSNTNTLVALNEVEGEKLRFFAESGVRMAISVYKKETAPIEILSWREVYNQPEEGYKVVIKEELEDSMIFGMYDDSDANLVKFLGKSIQEKGINKEKIITKEILVTARVLSSSPSPSLTPTPTPQVPNLVVNSGHRKANKNLQEVINDANPGDVIEVVQTTAEDREGGDPIIIDKPLYIKGVYRPTKGFSGEGTSEARTLIRRSIIITADNVTIEGLWIDPTQYTPINDSSLRSAESETGCYVKSSINGVLTDNPEIDCTNTENKLNVPVHDGAGIIVKGNNVSIKNNIIGRGKGSYDVGIYVFPNSKGVLIENNTFVDTTDVENVDAMCSNYDLNVDDGNTAIVINNKDKGSYVTIANNIFAYSKCDYNIGVEVLGKRSKNIDEKGEPFVQCVENVFWNNTIALGNLEGFGLYNINPGFVDWKNGIFTLSDSSPLESEQFASMNLGVAYDSSIFRDITIVDWEKEDSFESLTQALRYAIDGEKIEVRKVVPLNIRMNREGANNDLEEVEVDPILSSNPLLMVYPNDLYIYSKKGPQEDTRIPLFLDIVGDNIVIDGLKFELDNEVLSKFNTVKGDVEGFGIINLALSPLFEERPEKRYKYHWNNMCWVNCMKECAQNQSRAGGKDKKNKRQMNYNCANHCRIHYKEYCKERKGIKFSLSNSIIIRPGVKELEKLDSKKYNVAGISGGYLEEAILKNVVITSMGMPAYGDGVRFVNMRGSIRSRNKGEGKKMYYMGGKYHGYWHDGRGKFIITNSIIAGYIKEIEKNESNNTKGKNKSHNGCEGNCGNNEVGFDVVGVNASFTDRSCSSEHLKIPHGGPRESCDVIGRAGSCNCGTYTVCELSFWNPRKNWGYPIDREIYITKSNVWGNACDIKYEGKIEDWKGKHATDGISNVSYDEIVSVDPGFSFEGPEDQQFRIGSPLTDCGCNFSLGIDWDKFNQ